MVTPGIAGAAPSVVVVAVSVTAALAAGASAALVGSCAVVAVGSSAAGASAVGSSAPQAAINMLKTTNNDNRLMPERFHRFIGFSFVWDEWVRFTNASCIM
jgi:hypothetical protein